MKKIITLVFFICLYQFSNGQAWTQKSAVYTGGGGRGSSGFSIPSLGKIYAVGCQPYYFGNWEYDTLTDVWTQKTNYPGGADGTEVGFSIGDTGYLGTGVSWGNGRYNDFYKYDPVGDQWTRLADFPGGVRGYAVSFSIGKKGYIGGGIDGNENGYQDFYCFNPDSNKWHRIADCPAKGISQDAVGFSINGIGYVGTGDSCQNNVQAPEKDFWAYNPDSDKWTRKADFPGARRTGAVGFATCSNGYVGMGATNTYNNTDFYEYDPVKDRWRKLADFPGAGRSFCPSFVVGKSCYVALGATDNSTLNDIWEFIPKVTPGFIADTSICKGGQISFTDTSGYYPDHWMWHFSNGKPDTSSTQNPIVEYDTSGNWDVTLTAWNGCGDTGTVTFSGLVHVGGGGALDIEPQSPTVCSGTGVELYVNGGGANFTWNPSTGLSASTGDSVFANPTINVTYTVSGASGGCVATGTDDISIVPAPNKPTISKSANGDTLISSATQGNQWYVNDTLIAGATNQTLDITGQKTDSYTVEVINPANGCSATSDILIASGIGQFSVISSQLSIYPNPTAGDILITINSAVQNVKDWNLKVCDVLGRTLFEFASLTYTNNINLSDFSNGVYFITVADKIKQVVFPVVKQN